MDRNKKTDIPSSEMKQWMKIDLSRDVREARNYQPDAQEMKSNLQIRLVTGWTKQGPSNEVKRQSTEKHDFQDDAQSTVTRIVLQQNSKF